MKYFIGFLYVYVKVLENILQFQYIYNLIIKKRMIFNVDIVCIFIYCQSILDYGISDEVEKVRNDFWYKKMKV